MRDVGAAEKGSNHGSAIALFRTLFAFSLSFHATVRLFDENELELLIGGMAEIDLEDWRTNTIYKTYASLVSLLVGGK